MNIDYINKYSWLLWLCLVVNVFFLSDCLISFRLRNSVLPGVKDRTTADRYPTSTRSAGTLRTSRWRPSRSHFWITSHLHLTVEFRILFLFLFCFHCSCYWYCYYYYYYCYCSVSTNTSSVSAYTTFTCITESTDTTTWVGYQFLFTKSINF